MLEVCWQSLDAVVLFEGAVVRSLALPLREHQDSSGDLAVGVDPNLLLPPMPNTAFTCAPRMYTWQAPRTAPRLSSLSLFACFQVAVP